MRLHAASPLERGLRLREGGALGARAVQCARGRGAADDAQLRRAEPRQHGVGLRNGQLQGAGAIRRDLGGRCELAAEELLLRVHSLPASFTQDGGHSSAAMPRLAEFSEYELATTAWAFASAGHSAPALLDAIAEMAVRRLRDFKPQHLSKMAWAYAKAGHSAPALLDAIAAAAAPQLHRFYPQNLASTAWAFATAGRSAPMLLEAIATEAAPRLADFPPQHLVHLAWAFAAADATSHELFDSQHRFVELCDAAAQSLGPSDFEQLHQWQLWLEERETPAWPPLSKPLAARCRASFSGGEPSPMLQRVIAALTSLGLQPRQKVRTPLGYVVDAVVEFEGREVAVEVDGPSRFVGRVPAGATALKRRQLRAAGWTLLSVPYWEWERLEEEVVDGRGTTPSAYLERELRLTG